MFNNLYSPWRDEYFHSDIKECTFCNISNNPDKDQENRVFYRDEICFCVMNRYPYTPGHFMIIPHAHIDSPSLLSDEDWIHLSKLSKKAITLLEEYGAQGVNTGINIKSAAGAGIPAHLHLHFIPRFNGDTNFITTIAQTRVYGIDFNEIFTKISKLALKYFKGE